MNVRFTKYVIDLTFLKVSFISQIETESVAYKRLFCLFIQALPIGLINQRNSEPKLYISLQTDFKKLIKNLFFFFCLLSTRLKILLSISETILFRETVFSCACGHGDIRAGPYKVLAASLTLFQPGGQIMPTIC